jgi:sporulation-control protein spo0M
MKMKQFFDKMVTKIGIGIAKKMSPVIKEAIDNPENLKFEGYIKGDEIIVKIKIRNESK